MSMLEQDDTATWQECERAAEGLIARYDAHILKRAAFTQRVLEVLRAGGASEPHRAAMHVYSLALYAACSGAEGQQRQNDGYTELHRVLYASARGKYPDVCEEAAQSALVRTYERFGECRSPGAFIAFAFMHLQEGVRKARPNTKCEVESLDANVGVSGTTLGAALADRGQPDPQDVVIVRERRERLARCLAECLGRHPRAGKQLDALRMKYLDDLDDHTISRMLATTVQNVYVLRSRAIEKLRADPAWREVAATYGMLPDEPGA